MQRNYVVYLQDILKSIEEIELYTKGIATTKDYSSDQKTVRAVEAVE